MIWLILLGAIVVIYMFPVGAIITLFILAVIFYILSLLVEWAEKDLDE